MVRPSLKVQWLAPPTQNDGGHFEAVGLVGARDIPTNATAEARAVANRYRLRLSYLSSLITTSSVKPRQKRLLVITTPLLDLFVSAVGV